MEWSKKKTIRSEHLERSTETRHVKWITFRTSQISYRRKLGNIEIAREDNEMFWKALLKGERSTIEIDEPQQSIAKKPSNMGGMTWGGGGAVWVSWGEGGSLSAGDWYTTTCQRDRAEVRINLHGDLLFRPGMYAADFEAVFFRKKKAEEFLPNFRASAVECWKVRFR